MARPKHRTRPAATYFVTTSTRNHAALLQRADVAVIVEKAIFKYRDAGNFLVHAYVVMPDHFHAIVTPSASTSLEKSMMLIKGGSSHEVGRHLDKKLPLWTAGFSEHQIRDEFDFKKHAAYIHANPSKAGLAESYEFSSARGRYPLDAWPPASAAKADFSVSASSADLKVRPSVNH
jgi:putative transposase